MRSKTTFVLLAIMMACGTARSPSGGPTKSWHRHGEPYKLDLDRRVSAIDFKDFRMLKVLRHLLAQGIAIGAEVHDLIDLRVTLKHDGTTTREFLDSLVGQLPGYRWEVSGQTVRILPSKKPLEPNVLELLDRKIPRFHSDGLNVTETISLLGQHARANGLAVATGIDRSTTAVAEAANNTALDAKIRVNVPEGSTLREALTAIIGADPPAFWLAGPMPDGKRLTIMGSTGHQHVEDSPRNKLLKQGKDEHGRQLMLIQDGSELKWAPVEEKN